MTDFCRKLLLIAFFVLCVPSVCHANPRVMPVGPLIGVSLFFLVVEGIIIVLLAKSSALYRIRFITVWFFITLTTWIGLVAWLRLMPGLFRLVGLFPNDVLLTIFGECLVVLIEGAILWRLLQ